ncbi:MAG: DUF6328 family protein [Burkholderiaceae bacterium]
MYDLTSRQEHAAAKAKNDSEAETLKEELSNILEECRILLPGMQALFGFQTIAVFNQRFEELSSLSMDAHLLSLAIVGVAIALGMAPAALHRIAEPGRTSRRLIALSSRCICSALLLLMLAFALEMFVVFSLATGEQPFSVSVAALMFIIIGAAWFALPYLIRRRWRRQPS